MAIFRIETRIVGRRAKDKSGQPLPGQTVSIVAKAAYRSGERLKDEAQDRAFDYRNRARSQEVVHTEIIAPENAPSWLQPGDEKSGSAPTRERRERLWNTIERTEKRKDSQLAREFIISLPIELDQAQQIEAVRAWCHSEVTSQGFVADFALHRSKDGRNPHAHVLTTLRPVEGEGFGKKPDMSGKFNGRGMAGLGAKSDLDGWRVAWERVANAALEKAERVERIDHRSLKARGIDRIPEPKIGVEAMALKRKGKVFDPPAIRRARHVRMDNQILPLLRQLQQHGHVRQIGLGGSPWWAAPVTLMRAAAQHAGKAALKTGKAVARTVEKTAKESWQAYLEHRANKNYERGQEGDLRR